MRGKIAVILIVVLSFFLYVHAENTKTTGIDALSWVGVVYSNGILTPVFQIDADGIWTKCWPEPVNGKEEAMSDKNIQEIPKEWLGKFPEFPEKWRMLPDVSGKNTLSALKAHKYDERCTEEWGIITDFSSVTKTANIIESHSVITVAGDLKMELPVDITYTSKEHPGIAVFLRKAFDRVEDDYVSNYLENYKQGPYADNLKKKEDLICIPLGVPVSNEMRKKNVIAIREIKKVGNMYYFECKRDYPKVSVDSYTGNAWLTGWVYKNRKGEFNIWKSTFICTDGVIKGPYSYVVFGSCILNNKTYAIVTRNYYEWSDFAVMEVLEDGLKEVIAMEGSGC